MGLSYWHGAALSPSRAGMCELLQSGCTVSPAIGFAPVKAEGSVQNTWEKWHKDGWDDTQSITAQGAACFFWQSGLWGLLVNWNRRKAGRWFTFQNITYWMVNLKYDSLNSRSLQIFKSSSQKTAVIKNMSFSLPYCPLPKEGRKVSVVPSLWEICVTRSHQAALWCFHSCPCHCVPLLPPSSTTVFPVQQLSVNAAAAKWSWTATCMSRKTLPKCSSPGQEVKHWPGTRENNWQHQVTCHDKTSLQNSPAPNIDQPGAARVGKRPGKIPSKQGIFGLKQRISCATKEWKLPWRASGIWLHPTVMLRTATVYSEKSAPQSPSHKQVTKLSLMLITERLWKYLVLFKPCKKSSIIHCNIFFLKLNWKINSQQI